MQVRCGQHRNQETLHTHGNARQWEWRVVRVSPPAAFGEESQRCAYFEENEMTDPDDHPDMLTDFGFAVFIVAVAAVVAASVAFMWELMK